MTDSLQKLRELTESLTSWGPMTNPVNRHDDCDTLETGGYEWQVRNLMNDGKIAIADCLSPKGMIFPIHKHAELEYIILYSGKARVMFAGHDVNLNPGAFIMIEPNRPHSIEYLEDSRAIAITIPASEDWPK